MNKYLIKITLPDPGHSKRSFSLDDSFRSHRIENALDFAKKQAQMYANLALVISEAVKQEQTQEQVAAYAQQKGMKIDNGQNNLWVEGDAYFHFSKVPSKGMTAQEIVKAVDEGKDVYWEDVSYKVIKSGGEYYIQCSVNKHNIGLTWADGVTLNGDPTKFFIK